MTLVRSLKVNSVITVIPSLFLFGQVSNIPKMQAIVPYPQVDEFKTLGGRCGDGRPRDGSSLVGAVSYCHQVSGSRSVKHIRHRVRKYVALIRPVAVHISGLP